MPRGELRTVSPGVTLIDTGSVADAALVADALEAADAVGVVGVARGARTVVVEHARAMGHDEVAALVRSAVHAWVAATTATVGGAAPAATGPIRRPAEHVVPVVYDGDDLHEVARLAGLAVADVVHRHASGRYRVAFVGFGAGFGYLHGLDPVLHLPRRERPRPAVPAGAVAIGGGWAGVYPRSSPGGWLLLGRTDAVLWDPAREPPGLLRAGDHVRFEPVTR